MEQKAFIPSVKTGEIFEVAGVEFIKFPDVDGMTPAVTKKVQFCCEFGDNNNFAESRVLKRMKNEFLPKIIEAVGEENLCTIKTDLTTLDGLKTYGEMDSLVSLPTLDFYRANPEIFDRHKVNIWWWLATADSAKPRYDPDLVLCVAPSGSINYVNYYNGRLGVRPFCIFKSSIFGSSEE